MVLTIVVIIIQFCWIRNDDSFDIMIPFLSGLKSADTAAGNMFLLMYSYLPFTFFLLCFSGSMRELFMGYGLLLTIRGQSRSRLLGKLMLKSSFSFSCITAVMWSVYTIGCADWWMPITWTKQLQALMLYDITVVTMIQLQYLLELYMRSHYANGAVILFGLISLFVTGMLSTMENWKAYVLYLLLFPNLAFAQKNGVLGLGDITFFTSLWNLLFVYFVITALILQSFQRKDII